MRRIAAAAAARKGHGLTLRGRRRGRGRGGSGRGSVVRRHLSLGYVDNRIDARATRQTAVGCSNSPVSQGVEDKETLIRADGDLRESENRIY